MEKKQVCSEGYINRLNDLINRGFNYLSPVQKNFHLTLNGISRLVMLDRYSQKDKDLKSLQVGDIVLTTIKPDPKFSSRGIGQVIDQFTKNNILFRVIEIADEFSNNIDPN